MVEVGVYRGGTYFGEDIAMFQGALHQSEETCGLSGSECVSSSQISDGRIQSTEGERAI